MSGRNSFERAADLSDGTLSEKAYRGYSFLEKLRALTAKTPEEKDLHNAAAKQYDMAAATSRDSEGGLRGFFNRRDD